MAHLTDLRELIAALESLGDLKRIDREVSADLEAAAITRLSYERQTPAPLFENVAGVEPGFRLFGAPAAFSAAPGKPLARMALSLGMPAETTAAELVDRLARVRDLPPVPPKEIARADAACKQHVLTGDAATLDRFPVPRVHEQDGGRYANTWGVIIAQTPDGSWTNWSIARIMMIDGKHMTGMVSVHQHIGMVWQQWATLGKPMPYALVQGGDPAIPVIGGMAIPAEADEAGFIGALYGEPIEVVKAELSDLLVPASAEIVIEGHLSVERSGVEGPFGEFAGYVPDETSMEPVYTVEAITHRSDPIWPIAPEGRPVDEYHTVTGTGYAAEILAALRVAALPVTSVWCPPRAAAHWTVITVPADWRDALPGLDTQEFTHRIGKVLRRTRSGRMAPTIFVLDDDIDPANDHDLLWAVATRIHAPHRAEPWFGPIQPLMMSHTDIERHIGHGSVVVHDGLHAAPGAGRMPHSSFAQAYPADIRQRVLAHWDD
ncbi:UbiD family decarboxylase [Streptomyces sioyaensis]|uniref:UbiD family decarboxylase n=1 Tax=Streptomyces sioyaensis TaxID=67364 RepID=UPI00379E834E